MSAVTSAIVTSSLLFTSPRRVVPANAWSDSAIIKANSKHDGYVEYVQVNCNKKAEDSGAYKDIMASIKLK